MITQAENAQARDSNDQLMIFEAIAASKGGFAHVNKCVKDQLRAWYVDTIREIGKSALEDPDNYHLTGTST